MNIRYPIYEGVYRILTLQGALEEISGGEETGHDCHPLPAERQGLHGFV